MKILTDRTLRWRSVRGIACLLSYSIFFGCSSIADADNVLLIIADDLGTDSVGMFSTAASTAPTPTLDNLATNGVRFTRCWSNPTCSPSRASLLTGRHGFRTGVGSPGDPIPLSEGTLADAFNNAGYATACVGKWHLSNNSNGRNDNPNLMGFTHYCGPTGGGLPDFFAWTKVINGVTQPQITTYATTENVDDAIDWIDDQNGDWFCWLAFNAPHTPFHLPPNDLHSYNSLSGTQTDIDANPLPYYQAAVEALDTEVGRLLNSIDPAVLANTNVIFIGDNGTPRQVASRTLRGAKSSLYEGGVNVPCIVSGPVVAGTLNRTNDSNIQFVDFFKSILEIAGLDAAIHTPAGAATDSVSFANYLADEDLASVHDCHFTTAFNNQNVAQNGNAIANNEFKFVRYGDGDEEFFSRADERTNLLAVGLNGIQTENYLELIEKMAVLIDPPKVVAFERDGGSDIRPDQFHEVKIVFNQEVNISIDDLLVRNESVMQPVDLTGSQFSYDTNTFTATWDLSTQSSPLPAAYYTLELVAPQISSVDDDTALDGNGDGTSGPNYVQTSYVAIPGDADLDGEVSVLGDGFALVSNLGAVGATWSQGDFNGDGNVDVLGDGFILVANLQRFVTDGSTTLASSANP
jgi:arylsulfatase A-like enzyme